MYLHSHISDDKLEAGVDYRSATSFVKTFHFLDKANDKPILIHMHTIGGDVWDGLAMYDTIAHSKKNVTILGYAQVQSMSSVIFQAGDIRILSPNAVFMIHDISIVNGEGTLTANKSFMSILDVSYKRILDIYANKCIHADFFKERGYSVSQVKKFLQRKISQKTDWYMTPDEALYYGFTDYILGGKDYPTLDWCIPK